MNTHATALRVDIARFQLGHITRDDLRNEWRKGKYKQAPQEWAIWAVKTAFNEGTQ